MVRGAAFTYFEKQARFSKKKKKTKKNARKNTLNTLICPKSHFPGFFDRSHGGSSYRSMSVGRRISGSRGWTRRLRQDAGACVSSMAGKEVLGVSVEGLSSMVGLASLATVLFPVTNSFVAML